MSTFSVLPAELQLEIFKDLPNDTLRSLTLFKSTQQAATSTLYKRDAQMCDTLGPRALIWSIMKKLPGTALTSLECGGRKAISSKGFVNDIWVRATPLHAAAVTGDERLAALLLEHGADVDVTAQGSIAELRKRHYFYFPRDGAFSTPLFAAMMGRHDAVAHMLLDHGASLQLGCSPRCPTMALHVAALTSTTTLLERILADPSVDINATDDMGRTALHWATSTPRGIPAAKRLLELGPDVTLLDKSGRSVLYNIVMLNHLELTRDMILSLLCAGAKMNDAGTEKLPPLKAAIKHVSPQMLRFLIDNGASVKYHEESSVPVVKLLLESAAAKSKWNYKLKPFPPHIVKTVLECTEILWSAGAKILPRDVLKCLEYGMEPVGKFLLDKGVPAVDIRDHVLLASTVANRPWAPNMGMQFILDHCLPKNLDNRARLDVFRSFLETGAVREPHLFIRFMPDIKTFRKASEIRCDLLSVLFDNQHYEYSVSNCLVDFLLGYDFHMSQADPTVRNHHIHQLVMHKRIGTHDEFRALLNQLMAFGMDVNAKDWAGRTALHVLAQSDRPDDTLLRAMAIIERGADVYLRDREGRTALEVFVRYHDEEDKAQTLMERPFPQMLMAAMRYQAATWVQQGGTAARPQADEWKPPVQTAAEKEQEMMMVRMVREKWRKAVPVGGWSYRCSSSLYDTMLRR